MSAHTLQSHTLTFTPKLSPSGLARATAFSLAALCVPASAQTSGSPYTGSTGGNGSGSVSASVMWATSSGGGNVASAQLHQLAGESAASVEMARKGILYLNGASIAVQAIGAQTIVSTTIIGDGNAVDVDAKQEALNSGDVSVSDVTIRDIGL